jgi:hypothetical protein
MKAPQSFFQFLKLPRNSRTEFTERRKLERFSKLFAATFRRLVGTGERLRATLGDETD